MIPFYLSSLHSQPEAIETGIEDRSHFFLIVPIALQRIKTYRFEKLIGTNYFKKDEISS